MLDFKSKSPYQRLGAAVWLVLLAVSSSGSDGANTIVTTGRQYALLASSS